jgi:iron complex transport system ATP-binding protein
LSDIGVEISGVTYGYGSDPAVSDISFSVERGEFLGIIGPNGSGKSTLLRLVSGVLPAWRGQIRVDGKPVSAYTRSELCRRIAVVPQETKIDFPFSVTEVVLFGRTPHLGGFGFEGDLDLQAAERAMARTQTSHLARRAITQLSGGERQRVIVARALAQEPRFLLLDEPGAFLDIRHEVEMYDLLRELQAEGITILTVLHDLNLAALYCDRVALLDAGRLAQVGPPEEVLTYATLTRVYGTEIYVHKNDITGGLNVLPLNREQRDKLRSLALRAGVGSGEAEG